MLTIKLLLPEAIAKVILHGRSGCLLNVEKDQTGFSKLGLGIEIKSENLRNENLEESVDACANDPSYRKNAERLMSISKEYNGTEKVTEIIQSYR